LPGGMLIKVFQISVGVFAFWEVDRVLVREKVDRRKIAVEYFKLVSEGKFREGLRFFAPDCRTHNPYVAGSMESLTDAMVAASKDPSMQGKDVGFAVKHVLVDGDFVAVHTELLNSKSRLSDGGLRQVHLFRFEGDKIVEYWDITQQILRDMPNAKGAF
jgi:predicted SnoaL-like aldol condensation-catalyzing enzyme